jgi:hypothetical protein
MAESLNMYDRWQASQKLVNIEKCADELTTRQYCTDFSCKMKCKINPQLINT